jgi:hypothetical protein
MTAHRSQDATVDRAFVLGSDELYREWGYTALSRHRDAARFYVSATPTFLNEAPPALRAGDDVAHRVIGMLEQSRAEHLALNGVKPDHRAARLADELERAEKRLADADERLSWLWDERERTAWYRRDRCAEIELLIDHGLHGRDRQLADIERLKKELARRPTTPEPSLWRRGDPLAAFEPSPRRVRECPRERDLGLER